MCNRTHSKLFRKTIDRDDLYLIRMNTNEFDMDKRYLDNIINVKRRINVL